MAMRARLLQEPDELHESMAVTIDEENTLPSQLRKTRHCAAPSSTSCLLTVVLLTVLALDLFQHQTNNDTVNADTAFWYDGTDAFHTNTTDYNLLCSDHPISVISTHRISFATPPSSCSRCGSASIHVKFTASGDHNPELFAFCDGSVDINYLREYLNIKPNLNDTVDGGFFYGDMLDFNRDHLGDDRCFGSKNQCKKWQMEMVKSINHISNHVMRDSPTNSPDKATMLLNCIEKLHRMVQLVKTRLKAQIEDETPDRDLAKSFARYQGRLDPYEDELEMTE